MASVARAKRGGKGQTLLDRGKRKREADRLKEARALVSTRQAHEHTHARTHTCKDLCTHIKTYGQGGTGEKTHEQ